MRPVIALTMGDPAGCGPEICLKAAADQSVLDQAVPVIFGSVDVLKAAGDRLKLPLPEQAIKPSELGLTGKIEEAAIVDCSSISTDSFKPGEVTGACGQAAYDCLCAAVNAAKEESIAGIATGPLNKAALSKAGISHPGHTEILAELTGTSRYCMMMACDDLAVGLVTTHVAYSDVPAMLTTERVLEVIELSADAMSKTGKTNPSVTVCGLNPHGGEDGMFGAEEQEIITPAVNLAKAKGLNVKGPVPPDTAFIPRMRETTDAYVVMYHDQGLIPFKTLAFDRGVNITLGLPIVRTSVDHGTAFDIAWQGKASAFSMVQAVLWAVRLSG